MKREKELDRQFSTSILVDGNLLSKCKELELVVSNRDNNYYHIIGTNVVIVDVTEGFSVLTDYLVTTVDEPKKKQSLPHILSAIHFSVYQWNGRDWVKSSKEIKQFGYYVKYAIHGRGIALRGQSLDHLAETFNELDCNTRLVEKNHNEGSHRYCIHITNMEELLDFVQAVRRYEARGRQGYLVKPRKKRK